MNELAIITFQQGIILLAGLALVGILMWFFWPDRGLLAGIQQSRLNSHRIMIEDALKYLYDCEYRNITCDVNSIAGNLNISGDHATRLMERLLSMGLISMNDHNVSLTDTGRSYSLRVIRVHRIWERYLADETGVDQIDWHHEADRIEHTANKADIEKLAAQMGNPVFDPHGDPIPTRSGKMPKLKGRLLSSMKEGEIGHIIHIEDEPDSIYQQLVVLGLYPGMQIYVTDVKKEKITIVAEGEELILTPFFANQITVEPQPHADKITEKFELLSSLKLGEKAEVIRISPNCRGQQRRRLMDLGMVPGSLVSAEMKSASGDPVGYRVMGTTVGIRKMQADLIYINKLENHEQ